MTLAIILGAVFGSIGGFFLGSVIVLQTEMPYTVVISDSMVPALNVGDLVIVQGVSEGQVTVGDVIIFHADIWGASKPPYPVIHRVINIFSGNDTLPHLSDPANNNSYYNGTWYETQGDAIGTPDILPTPYIYSGRKQIVGRMIFRIPYLGLPQVFFTYFGGQWFIFVIIGFLILLLIIFSFTGSDKKEEKTNDKPSEIDVIFPS